jgi:formate hydrogenlyase subunit 6/NADH:ubiquinone oxidoreductase subunit I
LAMYADLRGPGHFIHAADEATIMNILAMLWSNLRRGNTTFRFPERPVVSEGYRGLVCFNPELCTGCAICRFRCTARAITFTSAGKEFTWSYDPGQCTFCGRCVEGCKAHALIQDRACPPVYLNIGELKHVYTMKRKVPASKSTVATPIPAAVDSASAPDEGSK